MSHALVNWEELPWQRGNHPLEHKKVAPERSCTLLMFMPGFSDPNPCPRSHVLHVLEGILSLTIGAETVRVAAGELLILEANTPHRAANEGDVPVVLLAISDAALSLQSASSLP
jgi:mannose-6-phosphate isomerase-like protein (cupin superfamily)